MTPVPRRRESADRDADDLHIDIPHRDHEVVVSLGLDPPRSTKRASLSALAARVLRPDVGPGLVTNTRSTGATRASSRRRAAAIASCFAAAAAPADRGGQRARKRSQNGSSLTARSLQRR